ncbi:phage terminase large subunit [Parabacteroides sp.]
MAKNRLSKEKWRKWEERKKLILSYDFHLSDTSGEVELRTERARKDYAFFVETYFPHLSADKESGEVTRCGKFQVDAAKYLKAHRHTRAVFEWARGHAKSTHVSLMIPIWLMVQEQRTIHVMILVSKSEDSADRLLSDLQCELEFNSLLKADFNIRIDEGNWSAGEFKTADGMLFMAIGRGQSPRGIKNRGQRPDYIVIDDIDDDEMVRNPARVSQAFDWCLSALLGAMDMGRGRFVLVGNRIGKDSILSRFAERPDTHHTVVNAIDTSGQPSWAEKYSREEILQLRNYMGERRFQKEYMNNPVNEGAVFLRKHIRYGKMLPLKEYRSLICYTDPSFKASTSNDFKATMLVGKTREGAYHLLKAYADQTSVSNMVAWHYEIDGYIAGRVPVMYYMESNFIQDLMLDEFKKVGDAVGHQIPIRGDARKKPDKFSRIEAMQPLFERGLIVLNEKEKDSPGMTQLVEQLLMFEKGSRAHDDAPDALEGAVFLLNQRGMACAGTYRVGRRPSRRY